MKLKNYFMMMALSLLALSCHKIETKSDPKKLDFNVNQIQASFGEIYNPTKESIITKLASSTTNQSAADNKSILWEYTYYENSSNSQYPISLTPIIGADANEQYFNNMTPKGYRLIASQQNQTKDSIFFNFREVYPNESYITSRMASKGKITYPKSYIEYAELVNFSNFSGYIIYYTEMLQPTNAEYFVNGILTNAYKFQ